MKNSMLCSSPDDALSVLRSGVLQMAMAIHLSIAFSNPIERLKWLVCILIIFLISHCISISVGRGVASGQGWNILVSFIIYVLFIIVSLKVNYWIVWTMIKKTSTSRLSKVDGRSRIFFFQVRFETLLCKEPAADSHLQGWRYPD